MFDVSSYGEVRFNNFSQTPKNRAPIEGYDQSVSLVQMQDSMAFDDIKGLKKGRNNDFQKPIMEESSPHDSQMTGNFDMSNEKINGGVNDSKHYMEDGLKSPGQDRSRKVSGGQHYYQ